MPGGEGAPVAWRVKDFADFWTLFDDEEWARQEAEGAGNLVQPLYAPEALAAAHAAGRAEGIAEAARELDDCERAQRNNAETAMEFALSCPERSEDRMANWKDHRECNQKAAVFKEAAAAVRALKEPRHD